LAFLDLSLSKNWPRPIHQVIHISFLYRYYEVTN